jgi:hypothetical protein
VKKEKTVLAWHFADAARHAAAAERSWQERWLRRRLAVPLSSARAVPGKP